MALGRCVLGLRCDALPGDALTNFLDNRPADVSLHLHHGWCIARPLRRDGLWPSDGGGHLTSQANTKPPTIMIARPKAFLKRLRSYFKAYFAHCRNVEKVKNQTHIHQRNRRFIRPCNVQATRTADFKRRYGIA